jgi:tripartite-type tricarboxylate transporter receptor subunit TctC
VQLAATLNRQPTMLVVHPSKPWKTVPELTAAMKEKGEKGSYAITNTVGKVMGATYKKLAGLTTVEVPYKTTAETLNDLQSGAVDYAFHDNAGSIAYERQGRVRILAVSTAARLQAAPQFPTMTEQGYPMDMVGWWAAIVPSATPRPIVNQINAWINQIITSEDGKRFLHSIASDPWVTTPDEAQAYLRDQIVQWGKWIREANIEPLG